MTTRLDHTHCGHDLTPAARRRCRIRRNAKIKACQVAFMEAAENNDSELIREYEAMVDLLSMDLGIDFHAAFDLVERGPVIH